MKFFILAVSFILVLGTSCSKDKSIMPAKALINTQDSLPQDTISNDTTVINLDSCYGVLSYSRYFKRLANHSLQLQTGLLPRMAMFSDTLLGLNEELFYSSIVDSVKCNGIDLSYDGHYYYSPLTGFMVPNVWSVKGNLIVPDFSFTNSDPFPFMTSYVSLPDTIHLSNGFSKTLTGLSNQSKITFSIVDGNTPALVKTKIYQNDSNACFVSFSPSELSDILPTSNGRFNVTLIKDNVKIFEGKQFNFKTITSIGYYIVLD